MADPDPDYFAIISRETVERLAQGDDKVAMWAREMLGQLDEEAIFLRGARAYFESVGLSKRREALASLAVTFDVKREDLKRYLRFKGLVNRMD